MRNPCEYILKVQFAMLLQNRARVSGAQGSAGGNWTCPFIHSGRKDSKELQVPVAGIIKWFKHTKMTFQEKSTQNFLVSMIVDFCSELRSLLMFKTSFIVIYLQ